MSPTPFEFLIDCCIILSPIICAILLVYAYCGVCMLVEFIYNYVYKRDV